jgi:hypothetical protein
VGLTFDADFGEKLTVSLTQTGERIVASVNDVLADSAEEIQRTAQWYAPEDSGALEEAIKVKKQRGGLRGRNVFTVFVDPNVRNPDGTYVGSYADLMHEFLAPYGDPAIYFPGKGTRSKGPQAGGKYLARAFQDIRQRIAGRVGAAVRKAIHGY